MQKESSRSDLDHEPDNAADVGEQHKKLNQEGEQPRKPSAEPDPENPDEDQSEP